MEQQRVQRQQFLQFDCKKELARRERIERLLGNSTTITTAARLFDYHEATELANRSNDRNKPR